MFSEWGVVGGCKYVNTDSILTADMVFCGLLAVSACCDGVSVSKQSRCSEDFYLNEN